MKRYNRTLLINALASLVIFGGAIYLYGCDNAQTDPSPSSLNASTEATANAAATDVDADLDAFARALALSIGKSPNLTGAVVNGVSERFNGDTEIMWKDIAERRVDGASFGATLTSSFAQADSKMSPAAAAETIDEIAARNPRLHIAVRGDVDAVSVEQAPLVAFAPESIDDMEVERIKAYDTDGNVVWLDGQNDPDFPVIVIGLNERTDENGNLLPDYRQMDLPGCDRTIPNDPDCHIPPPPPPPTNYPAGLWYTNGHLDNDKEGWPRGDPELEIQIMPFYDSDESSPDDQFWQDQRISTSTCEASQSNTGWRYFDQNDELWNGRDALILDWEQVSSIFNSTGQPVYEFAIALIEDDITRCVLKTDTDLWFVAGFDIELSHWDGSGIDFRPIDEQTLATVWNIISGDDDDIAGFARPRQYVANPGYPGYSHILIGESGEENNRNGAVNLLLRTP